MNKAKRIGILGRGLSMAALAASTGPAFGQANDMRAAQPEPLKRYNSNKPSKKRAKVKLARKQKHRK